MPSLVVIENVGSQPAHLNISTTDGHAFSWQGEIKPGQRVLRTARFTADAFKITCRDVAGRAEYPDLGYVSRPSKWLITVKVDGCEDVFFDYRSFP